MSLRPAGIAAAIPTFGNGLLALAPACGGAPRLGRQLELAIVPAAGRSGARYLDLSGKGRHATTTALSFSTAQQYAWGPHGFAYNGRGANNDAGMQLRNIPALATTSVPWTVSVIARQATSAAAERGIVVTAFGGLCWDTSRNGFYAYRDSLAANAAQSATNIDPTVWHHYVVTYNGLSATPQLWVDGWRGESSFSGTPTPGTNWQVGRSNLNGWNNLYLHGLWIWSRRLGDAEVLAHFADPYALHRLPMPLRRRLVPTVVGGQRVVRLVGGSLVT